MPSRFVRRISAVVLGLASALASAAPTVMTFGLSVQNTSDQAQNYSFAFSNVFAALGSYDLKFSLAGAYADGARNGASVAPTAASGKLFDVVLDTANGKQTVGSVGDGAAFAGAGGNAGEVKLSAIAVKDSAAPSAFTFNFSAPFAGGRVVSRGAVAGASADGGTDGVSMGPIAGQNLADFGFRRNDATDTLFGVSDSDNTLGNHGSVMATGNQLFDCATAPACTDQLWRLHLQGSGDGDAAAFVMRNEVGGDDINGTVIDLIHAQLDTASFSCAANGGCSATNAHLAFALSAHDAAAFVLRLEINDAATVPAPGGLASLLLVAGAAGLAHRRARAGQRRPS